MNQNVIGIDDAKFKKISKKLQATLKNDYSLDIKLNETQEMVSKALGFRNVFELKKRLETGIDENPVIQKIVPKKEFLSDLSAEQIVNIVQSLMPYEINNSLWQARTIEMLSVVVECLIDLYRENDCLLSIKDIKKYCNLENLSSLSKRMISFENKELIRAYLKSLPRYDESATIQNGTIIEQHYYLELQLQPIFLSLKKVEDNNFIIASKSWFDDEMVKMLHSSQILKDSDEIKLWKDSSTKAEIMENSWLGMKEYKKWLSSMWSKDNYPDLRVSDLIVYITEVVATKKKQDLLLILKNILENYSVASKLSIKLQ